MTYRAISLAAFALFTLYSGQGLEAQSRLGFEIRGGLGSPNGELDATDLERGFGFEGSVSYRLLPHLATYLGWDWWRFPADDAFAGPGVDLEETGYAFGLRFEHPFAGEEGNGPAWWIRAGGTADHFELEDGDGELISDSGHGLGWEVGGGLSLPVGSWRFTPGVRLRSLRRDIEVDTRQLEVELHTLAFEVGFARGF